ncbi:MAG: alpha/beta fold hydrolase [Treponema sp.]|jgi:dienelactone hydrolase|nr:alpha/beta fold hydrolase [Treponema sp.]
MMKMFAVMFAVLLVLAGCVSTETTKAAGNITSRTVSVPGAGRQVPATLVLPDGKGPFPLVVMEHGFAGSREENGGFGGIADALAQAGIASVRMDFPGCGESPAPFLEYNFTANIADAEACREWAIANANIDKARTGILGYSNGGRQALILAGRENPYKALGLLAPAFFTNTTDAQHSGLFNKSVSKERLAIARSDGFYAMEWFGRTLEVSAKYYEDEIAAFDTMDKLTAAIVGKPCLVVYGAKDDIVPPAVSKAAAAATGAQIVEIPGADHGYGFYSDQPDVTAMVQDVFVQFFKKHL